MKESRFIELLNLYVDQQLEAAEAAELEQEILRNPARRNTYQQYCRIQKGCTVLFEQERSLAPRQSALAASLAAADRKIISFPERGSRRKGVLISFGSLAAAACLAVVVVARRPADTSSGLAATEQQRTATVMAAEPPAQDVTLPSTDFLVRSGNARPEFYSVIPTRHLMTLPEAEADRLAADAAAADMASTRWMRDLEMAPLSDLAVARLTLDDRSSDDQERGELRSRKPVREEAAELTAFEFRR